MKSVVAVVVLLGLVPACNAGPTQGSEEATPREVTGVITAVDLTGLTDVEGFTVRNDQGTFELVVTDETKIAFPPAHLNEHRVSGDPVTVVFKEQQGDLIALSIEDA